MDWTSLFWIAVVGANAFFWGRETAPKPPKSDAHWIGEEIVRTVNELRSNLKFTGAAVSHTCTMRVCQKGQPDIWLTASTEEPVGA